MSAIVLILSSSLIIIAYDREHIQEKLYILKLIGYWLLVQLYITINYKFPLPVGLAFAVFILLRDKKNIISKIYAIGTGLISFALSFFVYLVYSF